tara:strand:+ start:52 stop:795 length:744 start_codon:yes stop_codon:yes gene_type:complete
MIPKIIYQTWKSNDTNHSIDKLKKTWVDKNPNFEYIFFDDNDIIDFIRLNFDERINKCYKRILNGSLKADFFRYCVLYINGGVYIDIDISCETSLTTLFNFDEIKLITSTDNCRVHRSDRIYQGFLGGEENCKVFKMIIDHICSSIENGKFKNNIFDLSGPVIFSKILKEFMNIGINENKQKCIFLKEQTFINPTTNDKFIITTHDISKEKLQFQNKIFAVAQNKFDRQNNPHYLKNRAVFKQGFYI